MKLRAAELESEHTGVLSYSLLIILLNHEIIDNQLYNKVLTCINKLVKLAAFYWGSSTSRIGKHILPD